jgi:putative lipoprotein
MRWVSALRRCALVLAIGGAAFLLGRPVAASEPDPDPWWGKDKALHLGLSVGLAAGGYAATSALTTSMPKRALGGAVFSLALGASKELYDLGGGGTASWRDFAFDTLGTAIGVALSVAVDALVRSASTAPRSAQ